MRNEPTRQIHLDFHTSEAMPDIGSRFSKTQFQEALRIGHVNQINVFAKCHHGWSYYPTKTGRVHPNLKIDLLGSQIEACHEIGVEVPIYYTGGWSAADAEDHPDWCLRDENGDFVTNKPWPADVAPDTPKPLFQWKHLCFSGGYHELCISQVEEICDMYPVDGMFFDIYFTWIPCYCDNCRKGMADKGFNVNDKDSVLQYRALTIRNHTEELARIIKSKHPNGSIYFNGLNYITQPLNFRFRMHEVNTKNDLEDLPTTWGGYDKFPLRAKVFHRENKAIVGMSGKFHTNWGEFGGFKNPDALRFEAASMISYGASCNFGDHLHPLGEMDLTTYSNVGQAFEYVEKIESYGPGGLPASTLGFWASYELEADEGLTRMLLEEQIDFDIAQPGDDLSRFQTIVVPSKPGITDSAKADLESFVDAGGSIVILGEGALTSDRGTTVLNIGASYLGEAEFDQDYTLPGSVLHTQSSTLQRPAILPGTPFLNYSPAARYKLTDAEELASVQVPYFSRTYGHYCGHQNTPNVPESAGPSAWRTGPGGRIVVTAHALDRLYYVHGAKLHRDYFARLLRLVHTAPMVEATLPSAGRVSLLHQKDQKRYVAHLLYGAPIERGRCIVIEDLPELHNVKVRIRVPESVKGLRLEPAGIDIKMTEISAAGSTADTEPLAPAGWRVVETVVPSFSCHAAVVAEY